MYIYIYLGNWVFNLHYIQPHLQTKSRSQRWDLPPPLVGWSPEAPRNALPAWALKKHRRSERLEILKVPNDPPSTQQNTGWSYNLLWFFDFFWGILEGSIGRIISGNCQYLSQFGKRKLEQIHTTTISCCLHTLHCVAVCARWCQMGSQMVVPSGKLT